MDERAKLGPTDGLSVIVVDEDKHHANSTRSMLCTFKYRATAYTSPLQALEFLEGHAQDVDVALVAVNMEEMHGFQFLDIVREAHKNIQVLMMSTETTLDTMKICIELGACFLVQKPIGAGTIENMWQHLDLKDQTMDNIKCLLQGKGEEAHDLSYIKESTKTKKSYICWNGYLQAKFLTAIEILGTGASPTEIEVLMNAEGVKREHISSHLQKYRMQMEQKKARDAMMGRNGGQTAKSAKNLQKGPNTSLNSLEIQHNAIINDEEMPHAQTGSFNHENAHTAMLRSIQFGTMYDEPEYSDFSSSDEATEDGVDMMEHGAAHDDGASASCFNAQVSTAQTFPADDTKKNLNNNNSEEQDRHVEKAAKYIKLVDYSDSEDDQI